MALASFAGNLEKKINFDINDLSFSKVEEYDLVTLENCFLTIEESGAPCLPKASVSLLTPQDAEIMGIEIVYSDTIEIRGNYNIYPTQRPIPFIKRKSFEFVGHNEHIYSKNTPYPEKIIGKTHTGSMGGYNITSLIVYPLQYIPADKKLIFHSNIKFKIIYENKPRSLETKTEKQNKIFKERVKNLVINPEDIGTFGPSAKLRGWNAVDSAEYVIITVDSFKTAFQELADWKTKKGTPARVVTVDSIYNKYTGRDNAEKIRNFIKEVNSSWGTIWILLGGQCDYEWGHEIVPRRDVWYRHSGINEYPNEDTIPSDLYFSDLNGDWNADGDVIYGESSDEVDLYSDVFVGRAPVRTVTQAENFVNKVLTYEKNPPSGYQKKILLPAAYLWPDIYDETLTQEAIANMIPGDWQVSRMYERNGNLTHEAFIDSVQSGFGFAHLVGHGNEHGVYIYYADSYFNSEDLDVIDNNNLLGIHNSTACMSGALDYVPNGDCFAEHYLTSASGGGFSIMNSRYGWGYPPAMGPSELIDTCFYHEIFRENYNYHNHLGVAHAFSKDGYVSQVSWTSFWAWCIYELNLFGDPEMPLWTDDPKELTVNHDAVIPIGASTFTVNVTDGVSGIEAALVCLYKEGEVYSRGYTDAFGEITLNLSPAPASPGVMYCTVTKNNYIPCEDSIAAISPSGGWIVFEQYTITESSGNGDGNVDPGESIELPLTVHNVGFDPAIGVSGIIRTEDSYITLIDSSEDFGDILTDSLANSMDAFDFDVATGCPGNNIIHFKLIVNDEDDSTWISNFSIPVSSPEISLSSDTLNFDTVFIGYTDTLELFVNNIGADTLKVSNIISDNIDYSVDITNFNIPPTEHQTVEIIFLPSSEGISIGNLTIASNDLDEPSLIVFLEGEGLEPPDISVSPDSLSDSLFTGKISVDTLTIYNTGLSDLNFNITFDMKFSKLSELVQNGNGEKEVKNFTSIITEKSSLLKPAETAGTVQNFVIRNPQKLASPLILRDDFEDSDYDGWLDAGSSGTKEITNATTANGTVHSYQEYSSPLSHFNGIYQEFDSIQPCYISFYIRSGSTSTSDAYWVLQNSSGDDVIWFFAKNNGYLYINGDMGGDESYIYTAETWYHIELKNIDFDSKTFDYYVNEELIKTGISFRNAVYTEEFSRLDIYNYTEGSEAWWDEILIATEESYWIDIDNLSGTIPSNDSVKIEVTFDATGLYGGSYYANIIINSNDPDEPEVIVPTHLHVTGAPDIAISADTLDCGTVYSDSSVTDTLVILNIGTDALTVSSISSDNSDYTIDTTNFILGPAENQEVLVTFSPSTAGTIIGNLTIISDDPNESTVNVALLGECKEPPDISVFLDFLSDTLSSGQMSNHTLTIYNMGESDLNFDISINGVSSTHALEFDGVDDYVEVPDNPSLSAIGGTLTLELWMNVGEYPFQSREVLGKWSSVTSLDDEFVVDFFNSGKIRMSISGSIGGYTELLSNTTISPYTWTHVAGVFDSASTSLKLFINGNLDTNITPSTITLDRDTDQPFRIGTYDFSWHSNFNGQLDEVRIWNTSRTQEEIQANMYQELSGTETGLIGYWKLNEGQGDTAYDYSLNNNNGILLGGTAWTDSSAPVISWLYVDTTSGTIPGSDSSKIEVTFDATDLEVGDYYANIVINSNDPDEPEIIIPAHLHVPGSGIEEKRIPKIFFIQQNYPNPFNNQTVIRYGCPEKADVSIQVFDCLGRIVHTLIDKEVEAGYHEVKWDGSNKFGNKLSNSVYFYRIQAGKFTATKKMILLR